MPRSLPCTVPVVLAAALLAGCSSDPEEQAGADPTPAGSASPSAVPSPSVPAIDGLDLVTEELAREHREGPIEYDRVPPVGGPHSPRWLACDVYDEPVPAEVAVHSLEHGAVWLTYAPDLPADEVEQLAELAAADEQYVLVSPVPELDAPVVAVAWGVSLEATSTGDPRLAEFVAAYAGGAQGGEPGVPCRDGGIRPREARGLLQTQA